eukprot:jgi/Psemu1/46546/gm1.46546_g
MYLSGDEERKEKGRARLGYREPLAEEEDREEEAWSLFFGEEAEERLAEGLGGVVGVACWELK